MAKQRISEEELAAAFLAKAVGTDLNKVDAAHIYKGTHTARNIDPKDFITIDHGPGRRGPATRNIKDPNIIEAPRAKSMGREPAGMAPMPNLDLIPLPDDIQQAISAAPPTAPPVANAPVAPPRPPQHQAAPQPKKDVPQLEFEFDITGKGKDIPQTVPELYKYMEAKFTQIDIRLNNLFDMVKTVL
ncbi:MAG: hypothetical protein ACXADH_17815, partial [Candidatus Kariarchaeaceae archaeon]